MPIIFNKSGTKKRFDSRQSQYSRQRPETAASGSSLGSHHQHVHRTVSGETTSSHASADRIQPQSQQHGSVRLYARRLTTTGQHVIHRTRGSIYMLRERGRRQKSWFRNSLINPINWPKLVKKGYQRWHLKHLIPLFFVTLYMLIGAILFVWLEAGPELERIHKKNKEYRRERHLFIKRIEEILVDRAVVGNPGKRRMFLEEAVDYLHQRIDAKLGDGGGLGEGIVASPLEPQWSFTTAMYFAGTLFTTIGYGDIACETAIGRLVTILYAIFGIPLMLITLNELGKFLYKNINGLVSGANEFAKWLLASICCCCYSSLQKGGNDAAVDEDALERGEIGSKKDSLVSGTLTNVVIGNGVLPHPSISPGGKIKQPPFDSNGDLLARDSGTPSARLSSGTRGVNFNLEAVPAEDPEQLSEEDNGGRGGWLHKTTTLTSTTKSVSNDSNQFAVDCDYGERRLLEDPSDLFEDEKSRSEQLRNHLNRSASDSESEDDEDEEFGELLPEKEPPPRMPVFVAVAFTLSWIFFCAALFRLWEEWSYGEALYFMFISLLTVGLGDVNVSRRDLMMVCFVFVIVGLSMVSMCINVIQASLEDLYKRLLMKILTDYQKKLEAGGDQTHASLGIIKALGSSTTARLLMPMLSAETKRTVMHKVKEEAREQGIEPPPLFEYLDRVERMIRDRDPAITEAVGVGGSQQQLAEAAALLQEIVGPARSVTPRPLSSRTGMGSRSSSFALREATTQTDSIQCEDKNDQTTRAEVDDLAVQVDLPKELSTEYTQTDRLITSTTDCQTDKAETREAQLQTAAQGVSDKALQTAEVQLVDECVQSYAVVDEHEVQTDEPDLRSRGIQTPVQVFSEADCQCDLFEELGVVPAAIKESRFIKARRNWNGVLRVLTGRNSKSRKDSMPAMAGWQDVEGETTDGETTAHEDEGDTRSLNWNPIDGKHAERQRSVRDLKSRFEKMEKRAQRQNSVRRSSLNSTGKGSGAGSRRASSKKPSDGTLSGPPPPPSLHHHH